MSSTDLVSLDIWSRSQTLERITEYVGIEPDFQLSYNRGNAKGTSAV